MASYYKKYRPMSLKRINMMMKDFGSDYHLEELETGEIVMVRNTESEGE